MLPTLIHVRNLSIGSKILKLKGTLTFGQLPRHYALNKFIRVLIAKLIPESRYRTLVRTRTMYPVE